MARSESLCLFAVAIDAFVEFLEVLVVGLHKIYTITPMLICLSGVSFAQAPAQDLNKSVSLGDQSVNIALEPRDAGCVKKKQIQLNKMFCMAVNMTMAKGTTDKDLVLKAFDAVMPGHGHGMVTRSKIKASKAGEYLIEGLKLHMPGEWNFKLDLVLGKASAQVAIPLKL
jgi:hypothetical protein